MNTKELQIALYQAGFDPGPIDGITGKKTRAAIIAFQTAKGLKADGIAGPLTLRALGAVVADAAAPGEIQNAARVSPVCVDLIKAWEGLHDGNKQTTLLEPEPDPIGIYTLGWGHALTDETGRFIRNKAASDRWMQKHFGKPAITRDEAKALLATDINDFLESVVPMLKGIRTTQAQLDALVSFAFNTGAAALNGSTLLKRHKAGVPVSDRIDIGKLKTASQAGSVAGNTEYAFAAWSNSGGKWLLGLFRRRVSEALIYAGKPLEEALSTAQAIR